MPHSFCYTGLLLATMPETQVSGGSPADATVAFAITLRPFIEAALLELRAQQ